MSGGSARAASDAGSVLITGASAGFGEACARRYAKDGRALVLAARRGDRLNALASELSKQAPVHPLVLDVRARDAVGEAMESLPVAFRDVDILVNNAGLALGLGPAHETDLDDWQAMIDTNVTGLVYMTRAVLPGMVGRDRGHVVNVGSIAAHIPYPGGNVYGATKAFVAQFTRNLRTDLLGTRVRVTAVEPGLAETEFSVVRFKGDAERAAKVYRGLEALTAADIAEAVYWVTSLPGHVNVNAIEIMPTDQAWGPPAVHRRPS